MGTPLLVLAAVTLLLLCLIATDLLTGNRSTARLRDVTPDGNGNLPRVSIVIPARNEEKKLQEALQSVLKQDYPDAEFIAVNDRPTDGTGAILGAMSRQDPRLRVGEVAELPQGWLGKNHALLQGAQRAIGELLLFTDADIVMEPTALRRAVACLNKHGLEHLAAMPEVRMPGLLLGLFTSAFVIFFRYTQGPGGQRTRRAGTLSASGRSIWSAPRRTTRPERTKRSPCAPTTTSSWGSC
jgi:cellulose synthase/poly-beta-1,6-N-acetylglucosamine synthase-like glycosyltransferase